jgi:hypothetical protein
MAHPSLPVKSVQDIVAPARARPNPIAYASPGNGSAAYLAAEIFKLATGARMIHVPYKGIRPALKRKSISDSKHLRPLAFRIAVIDQQAQSTLSCR